METQKSNFFKIIEILAKHDVEYIIVGGISAVLHGAPVTTFDLDIVHKRSPENVQKLKNALEELEARYRVRKDIRIEPDEHKLASSGHHLLVTKAGPLDVLGIIGDSKDYHDLLEGAEEFEISDIKVKVQSLESLIEVKQFIGSDRDKAVIPVLQRTLEEKKKKE